MIAIASLIARYTTSQWTDIALITLTLILAWLFANTVFAMHYTHLFYSQDRGQDLGGLEVPNTAKPGYWDMFYFSFTLGMTFQTSDVTGGNLPEIPGCASAGPERSTQVSKAREKLYLGKLISSAQAWLPTAG